MEWGLGDLPVPDILPASLPPGSTAGSGWNPIRRSVGPLAGSMCRKAKSIIILETTACKIFLRKWRENRVSRGYRAT
jgi:hypothetical protein